MKLRTTVTFKNSAFNTTESKTYYINPNCFGDDLAKHVSYSLSKHGYKTMDEPGQEDFGWFIDFEVPEGEHCFIVGYRQGDDVAEGDWIGWIERKRGLVGSLLGGRKKGISKSAVDAIHAVLAGSSEVSSISWHFREDFEKGNEGQGTPKP